ncbi:M28 family peptidase [Pseudomonas subflava]|uniref:M28 family peptidase n=1 Tax=Pseudomonas subflava TaxID=2952933 RepID=UPI002079BE8B|nr:M28 family peptidase [Pseudomonas subflava]
MEKPANGIGNRLLEDLLMARGPGGQENEVRAVCHAELVKHCDGVWTDAAGNLIGLIRSPLRDSGISSLESMRIMAHLDEIAMIVKRVEPNGTLRVVALGGANPANFGMCPVDIMAEGASLPGVLSFGSMHATGESPQGNDVQTGAVKWQDVHVITRLSAEALIRAGVRPGTRVVLSRHWRAPWRVNDAIAAHFLDDRAPVAATLEAAALVASRKQELRCDAYFVFTTMEEESNAGAMYAARTLPGNVTVAVEVGPVLDEYGTELRVDPIVSTGDLKAYYTRGVAEQLQRAAERCGYAPQVALLLDFASDASAVLASGASAQAGCLAIPTENTHGYEVVLVDGITACARTLAQYLVDAE